jgi:hypothetical protein
MDNTPIVASIYEVEPKQVIKRRIEALVASTNATLPANRKVDLVDAYTVLARLMDKTLLDFQNPELREIKVMQEFQDFMKVASQAVEPKYCVGQLDMLPIGHPMSTKEQLSLSDEDMREHRISWLSADPRISEEHRPLVASAYRATAGSVERDYLVARIQSIPLGEIPRDTIVSLLES